jgi:hypothetical protein
MIPVYRASNNAEADVIKSLLVSHEIPATIQGYNHRSLLGFVGPYIELNILVPEEKEEDARQLIGELKLEEPHVGEARPPKLSKRNRVAAFAFAFIFPGFGSLYLHRKALGIVLISATAASLLLIVLDATGRAFTYAAGVLVAAMVCDMISAATYRHKEESPA